MKLLAASILGLGLGLAAITASQAMPLAPLDQAASANTIQVAGGCGPGWHRRAWRDGWGRWHWGRCIRYWR